MVNRLPGAMEAPKPVAERVEATRLRQSASALRDAVAAENQAAIAPAALFDRDDSQPGYLYDRAL
jgi:hypothetical protein